MFNWLLSVVDSGVISDTITPNNGLSGYGSAPPNQDYLFVHGVIVGFVAAIALWLLIKLCKYIFIKTYYSDDNESEGE